MALSILSCILVLSIVIAFYMMAYLLSQKNSYLSRNHIILCMSLLFYSIGYLMEINAADVPQVMAALQVENIGIPAIGPFFLLCMMQLCDSKLLRPWMGYAAITHVVLVFLMVLTNDVHHLFYTSYSVTHAEWTQVVLGKGPMYYYNQLFSLVCVLPAYVMLGMRFYTWTRSMRRRMTLIIVGSGLTVIANIVNVLDLLDNKLDITVFAYSITLVLFFIAVRRNRLYELAWLGANQAVQSMDDVMVVLDGEGGLVYYNDSAARLFPGIQEIHTSTSLDALFTWPSVLRGPLTEGEVNFVAQTPQGEKHFRCNISPIREGTGWSIVMRNVTEMIMLNQRLEELADTDALTGIYNRRHFIELLEMEMLRIQRYQDKAAIIMFDIDFFKRVNDTYGHSAGDKVLVAITHTVKDVLRASDIFARYGGEEFVILCPFTGEEEANILAERIRLMISQTLVVENGHELRVDASFGVAELSLGQTAANIINNVDAAMYTAKQTGRNRVVKYSSAGS